MYLRTHKVKLNLKIERNRMNPTDTNQNPAPVNPGAVNAPEIPAMPTPVNPVINPAAPVAPVVPVAPASPVNPVMPVSPVSPADPAMPTPVNPVINPGAPVAPVAPVAADIVENNIMVGATDPITMPNLPKAPDPVEEELNAPMTAAAPVPGSIGSAISVPALEAQAPNNVAFNDPAMAQASTPAVSAVPAPKKKDQKTLITLCILAGVVVVALAIVLVMVMNGMI